MLQQESGDRGTKQRSGKVFYKVMLVIVLAILLVAASYTWFSLSTRPRVSDLDIYINSPSGLEIATSADSEEWGQQVDFLDLVTETSPLKPCTWSDDDGCFYAVRYGIDGRIAGYMELSDAVNANVDDADGYYTVGTIYARTDTAASVSLSPAAVANEGGSGAGTYLVGTADWNSEKLLHDDAGSGAQYAVRIGLRITSVDETGAETGEESTFYIYEPNCDGHADGTTGYVDTASIDGTSTLVEENRLFTQTVSSWSEANPVQRTAVVYDMGEFTGETWLFDLDVDEIMRIDIYIWLEGQDVDCTNEIGQAARLFANLQFSTDYEGRTGLVPIE
ncbi:MAG: hypothetical protein LUD71_03075 [Clostridiales bacterium]|nr:hypothetical protein [Clostridiales bacterium]